MAKPHKLPSSYAKRPRSSECSLGYRKLHDRKQPIRDAKELARLSEQLGRRFEARAFLTIAVADDPGRKDLRQHLQELIAKPGPVGQLERRS